MISSKYFFHDILQLQINTKWWILLPPLPWYHNSWLADDLTKMLNSRQILIEIQFHEFFPSIHRRKKTCEMQELFNFTIFFTFKRHFKNILLLIYGIGSSSDIIPQISQRRNFRKELWNLWHYVRRNCQ